MTNEEYHSDRTRISKSGLDQIAITPANYHNKYIINDKSEPTEAMIMGTALHSAILEPELFKQDYIVLNDSEIIEEIGGSKPRSTSKYKKFVHDFKIKHKGKTIISEEDYNTCLRMSEAVWKHPQARALLTNSINEETILFTCQNTGVKCKIRPDSRNPLFNVITDIKTTEDASPEGFSKSVYKYRYHVQAAFYTDGFNSQCEEHEIIGSFIFIAVEKKAPYNIGVYVLSESALETGRSTYINNLITYKECIETNKWMGYSEDIIVLDLPGYAKKI